MNMKGKRHSKIQGQSRGKRKGTEVVKKIYYRDKTKVRKKERKKERKWHGSVFKTRIIMYKSV